MYICMLLQCLKQIFVKLAVLLFLTQKFASYDCPNSARQGATFIL